jgi:CRP-like cAMP-binding protein
LKGDLSFHRLRQRAYSGRYPTNGATLIDVRNSRDSELDCLIRIKTLSWLSLPKLTVLAGALALTNFKRRIVILHEAELASEVNILLTGIARITCLNARSERVTVALLAPGLISEFPTSRISQSDFQCEAYNDCRVGCLHRNKFVGLTGKSAESVFEDLRENDLKQWYRLWLRSSNFLSLGLRERIAITLLGLCSEFGIKESRGTLLRSSFSHKDIANLVGGSRPRTTEHLARLAREKLVIREGRQPVVRVASLQESIGSTPD